MTMAQVAARLNYVYKAILDGGKVDVVLDRIDAETLKDS
jgi:hypothetical protein